MGHYKDDTETTDTNSQRIRNKQDNNKSVYNKGKNTQFTKLP